MITEYGDKGTGPGCVCACGNGPADFARAGMGEGLALADRSRDPARAAGYPFGGSAGYGTGSLRSYLLRSLSSARMTPQSFLATAERAT